VDSQNGGEGITAIKKRLATIDVLLERGLGAKVDMEACQQIDLKLRKCHDPSFDPTSKQYKIKEAKKRQEKELKRINKLRKRQDEEERRIRELTGADSIEQGSDEPFSISRKKLKTPQRLRRKAPVNLPQSQQPV